MKLSRTQKKNIVPFVLVLANVAYFFVGGFIFQTLEYKPKTYKTTESIDEFLKTLSDTTFGKRMVAKEGFDRKDVIEKMNAEDITKFDAEFRKNTHKRVLARKPRWSFTNSLFFATTVVTTIGYGNLAPVTTAGRMFCIVYALIGIPLTLMLLAVVSNTLVKNLNDACAWIVSKLRTYHSNLDCEATSDDVTAPAWLVGPIIAIFLALMSSVYCALEGWDFGVSLYFIFITFSTIGFGDVVPDNNALTLVFQEIWVNLMLLYVGLSVVSIAINLCASGLIRQLKKTGKYLKILQFFGEGENVGEESNNCAPSGEDHRRDGVNNVTTNQDEVEAGKTRRCDGLGDQVSKTPDRGKSTAGLMESATQKAREKKYGSIHE